MKRFMGVAAVVVGGLRAGSHRMPVRPCQPPERRRGVTTGSRRGWRPVRRRPLRTSARRPVGLNAPWARELTRYGARDVSPYRIAHVRELQYRLKWVGLFPAAPTGYYGTVTAMRR